MKRFLFPLVVFVVLTLFLGVGLRLNPRDIPSPFIGKPAPAFRLTQLAEPDKTIGTEDMAGKVWVLNVWASWCVSCREEHEMLMAFAARGVAPVVGLDYKDVRSDGMAWLGRSGNPYIVSAFDGEGRAGIDYGVYGVPETFLIDKKGVIRLKLTGPLTDELVTRKLLPMIAELNHA